MIRKYGLASIALISVVFTLAGCVSQSVETEPISVQRIRVSGSSAALPIVELLADAYGNEDVRFDYLEGLRTAGGVSGVVDGTLDMGTVARDLTIEEESYGLEYVALSDDALAVAVHPSVTLDSLTSDQIRGIYHGDYQNWNELGGPDLGIVLLDRNDDESAKITFRRDLLGPDLQIAPGAVSLFYETDMIDALARTEGAIGYCSFGYGVSEDAPVTFVAIDGVAPSVGTVESGAYTMVRSLGVVTARPVDPAISEFLAWATSDEAHELMQESGFASPVASMGDR